MRSASLMPCLLSLPLVALVPGLALAAPTVTVTVDPAAGSALASQLGVSLDQLSAQLGEQIASGLGVLEPEKYVRALTDAQAFSNKGLGVDYASNPTVFVVGVAANFAMSLGDKGLGERYAEHPVVGVAPNISAHAGLNLGFLGGDRFMLFGNYFAQGLKVNEFDGDLYNIGFHLQAKFFAAPDDGNFLFKWGGFNLTSGYEHSRLTMELKKEFTTNAPLTGNTSGVSADASFTGTGTYTITTTSEAIPIELTTNIRLLYVLTLFAGAGYDIQLGKGTMDVKMQGTMSAKNPLDGSDLSLGTATIDVTQDAKPSPGRFRYMAGLQVNLSVIKVFVQMNAIPNAAVSAGAGVRVAW